VIPLDAIAGDLLDKKGYPDGMIECRSFADVTERSDALACAQDRPIAEAQPVRQLLRAFSSHKAKSFDSHRVTSL
jgi:hypothetical protein